MPTTPDLITAPQAALLLGVNRRTVLRMVAAGTLRAAMRTPGGAYLFHRPDVSRLMDTRTGGDAA